MINRDYLSEIGTLTQRLHNIDIDVSVYHNRSADKFIVRQDDNLSAFDYPSQVVTYLESLLEHAND